tara:strand:- start:463 stop:672 length:210 start_codon:yes stop_codon:yes gene_type:complete
MKIVKILVVLFIIFSYSVGSFAEEKKDCSQIDTSTGVGLLEKYKCKRGIESGEKLPLGEKIKSFFKKKN